MVSGFDEGICTSGRLRTNEATDSVGGQCWVVVEIEGASWLKISGLRSRTDGGELTIALAGGYRRHVSETKGGTIAAKRAMKGAGVLSDREQSFLRVGGE